MKRPFVFLSIALILGILAGYFLEIEIVFYIFILVIVILFYILNREDSYSKSMFVFLAVFILGLFVFKINNIETIDNYIERDLKLIGFIEEVDKIEEEYSRYILKTEKVGIENKNIDIKEKVLLTTSNPDFKIGDIVKINTVLKLPKENTNPLLFNYKNYLRSKNIRVTAYADENNIEKIGEEGNFFIKIKKKVLIKVEKSLEKIEARNKSFLLSMLLGDSNFMEPEDLNSFRDLGLAHVLAVSGLHLGIITSFLIVLLSLLTIDRRLINLISILFIFLYSYIIGFPPSILRAGIMLSIYFLSINMRRYSDPINNLFFVSFVLSIVNPYIIFSVGFQLSFLATLSVMTIPKYIKKYYIKSENRIVDSLITILGVQIGIMPLQIYYFNYLNILGIASNLLIIPIITIVLPLSLILFLLPLSFSWIGFLVSVVINSLLDIVFFIKDNLIGLGIGGLKLGSPSIVGIFFYYIILLVVIRKIRIDIYPEKINKFIFISSLIILLLNLGIYNLNTGIELDFIDVDQGDSILVKEANKNYLIDTGGNVFKKFDIGKNIVIPYLDKTGVKTLDGVFISHFDADHCKSLVDIMDEIKIKKIFISYMPVENQLYRDIYSKAKEKKVPIYTLTRGDYISLSKDLKLEVLGPDKIDYSLSDNDLSLVFNLRYKNSKILFTGDIEEYGEADLVKKEISKVDFLKVPHHGSKTSSSLELLEKLNPKEAFIQVGRDNSFSHPHREVVERYESLGANINRTDESGMIKLFIKDNNYEIKRYKDKKYSIMNVIANYIDIILVYMVYILIIIFLIKLYIGNKEWDSFEL